MGTQWLGTRHLVRTTTLALLLAGLVWLALAHSPSAGAMPAAGGIVAPCNEAALDDALAGGGLITFNCKAPVTIILSNQKVITVDTTIDAGNVVTLSGNILTRLFYVNPGVTLTLRNLILTDGYAPGNGGAVYVSGNTQGDRGGTLMLDHATIQNNHIDFALGSAVYADAGSNSGGCQAGGSLVSLVNNSYVKNNFNAASGTIYAGCDLNVINSIVSANAAITGAGIFVGGSALISNSLLDYNVVSGNSARGGAMYVASTGAARIENTVFASNVATGTGASGGAIFAVGTLTTMDSTLAGNVAARDGGALYVSGVATLTNSTLSGNTVQHGGGAVYIYSRAASLRLTNVALSGNKAEMYAGGLYNEGTATLTNVTLSSNSVNPFSGLAGGILNFGTATLTNVTLSSNSAILGGGLYNEGTATLTNVTLSGNSANQGGGVWHRSTSPTRTITLKDTIVTRNLVAGNCFQTSDSATNITSNGNNLSSDNSCAAYFTNNGAVTRDWNNANANLGPLADNGGFTLTHLPLPGSTAIDHGDACPSLDQRNVSRPQGPRCDIGAVEYRYRPGDASPWLYLPLIRR